MNTLRSISLAALMSAGLIATPAFALDLGGTVGGAVGGAIGPGGIGGSIGGAVDGSLAGTLRAGDRVGTINDRASRLVDRTRRTADHTANAIDLPDAPTAEQIDAALKAAGYGDATVETPVGSTSGSAEGSYSGEGLTLPGTPAVPDAGALATGVADEALAAKDAAVSRIGTAAAALPVDVSASAGGNVSTKPSTSDETEANAEPVPAAEPAAASHEATASDRTTMRAERRAEIERTSK